MKRKLLLIGHTYLVSENRKKVTALQSYFDVLLVIPRIERIKSFSPHTSLRNEVNESFEMVALPFWGNPESGTRYALRGLSLLIKKGGFDVILVEAEPWTWVRWQTWFLKRVYAPRALFGEFTWENLPRLSWKGEILRLIYILAAATSDLVIAGNQGAAKLCQSAGFSPIKTLVAPQVGVDPNQYCPISSEKKREYRATQKLPLDSMVVGFVGRWAEEKGIRDLLGAVRLCRAEGHDIHLALLGAGCLEAEVKEEARQCSWIHLFPPCPHYEVQLFIQSLDLFALPSRTVQTRRRVWKEQFGHVLIEAMACGVPVIGSDCGAIPEVIQNSEAIFPEGDREAMAQLILKVVLQPEMASAWRDRGFQLTEQVYSHRKVAETYYGFLDNRMKAEARP